MGHILIGRFERMSLPTTPTADVEFFFEVKDLGDI
jgi:hypothetical protein